MTHKERFLATIARQEVDRPASWLGLPVPSALPNIFKYFGVETEAELKAKLNDDVYPIEVPYNNPPTNDIGCALNFAKDLELNQDERTLTAPGFFEDITDPALIETYPWPNPADHIDVEESRRRVEAVSDDYFKMGIMWSAHFQDACAAFGMEQALIVMMCYPDMFKAVVDRIIEFHLEANKIFYEATKGKLDGVLIGNDFGSQCALMVGPDELREFILPSTKRLVDQAKSYGLKVVHHSCGSIYPIIGDLFDMGVDAVHPIQALATDMQAEKLAVDFAGRGAFFGGIDAQHLLVNGKAEDVAKDVARLKALFPTGLVLSPSHEAILPDIPPANIEAIFKSV
ncbi:MAG: uroporphyrinogen decarboxylase family protein [Rikenellaceae bacterium]